MDYAFISRRELSASVTVQPGVVGHIPLPIVVFAFSLPAVALVGMWMQAFSHRRIAPVQTPLRIAVGYSGLVAAAAAYLPLAPRVGGEWAVDIVVCAAVLWQLVVSIAIFGEPVPPGSD